MSRSDFVRGQLSEVSAPQALSALNNRWSLAAPGDFSSDIFWRGPVQLAGDGTAIRGRGHVVRDEVQDLIGPDVV